MSQNLPNMLENTIAKIREMVDVNSVVGEPITTEDGITIEVNLCLYPHQYQSLLNAP